jgi:hypothetical protein
MSVTETQTSSFELDDIDRALLLLVVKHRRTYNYGPTWQQLREQLGPEYVRIGWDAHWSEFQVRRPVHYYRLQHPALDDDQLAESYTRAARKALAIANARADQLRPRLFKLRAAGYITFTDEPRSLAPGPLLIAAQAKARQLNGKRP